MELDGETIEALSCKSSWDMWEFAVALHTAVHERRERIREAVAWHRCIRKEEKRRIEREYHAKNRDARNAARRERERLRRQADPEGMRAKERAKWDKRKAKAVGATRGPAISGERATVQARSVAPCSDARAFPGRRVGATVATSGP